MEYKNALAYVGRNPTAYKVWCRKNRKNPDQMSAVLAFHSEHSKILSRKNSPKQPKLLTGCRVTDYNLLYVSLWRV